MIQTELNSGRVRLSNGTAGIIDTRNDQWYSMAEVKPRDVQWFADATEDGNIDPDFVSDAQAINELNELINE